MVYISLIAVIAALLILIISNRILNKAEDHMKLARTLLDEATAVNIDSRSIIANIIKKIEKVRTELILPNEITGSVVMNGKDQHE